MKEGHARSSQVTPELPPDFDRRRRERIALKIPMRILICGLLMEKAYDAICTDLSEGGAAFDTSAELNVGDVVILEFKSKGETAYRCLGRLTYRMARRYGASFQLA